MALEAFQAVNLGSTRVKFLLWSLLGLALAYGLGWAVYANQPMPSDPMAREMVQRSVGMLCVAVMMVAFLLTLRWQILRTAVLALALQSLAQLFCALVLVLYDNPLVHSAVLSTLSVLFCILFIYQSNIPLYIKDRTFADAAIEGGVALAFLMMTGVMLFHALGDLLP